MKMRSVLVSLGACAAALSTAAVSASAAITNANADGNYMFPVVADEGSNLPEGCKLTDVYGFEAKLSKTPSDGENCIGGMCYQSDSNNWDQVEFGQASAGKPISIGSDGTVKLLKDKSLFAEGDTWGKVFVAEWSWDGDNQIDFEVQSVTLLDKDGNPLAAAAASSEAAPETTAAATDAAAETTAAAGSTTAAAADDVKTVGASEDQPASKTGDAGAALAIAGLVTAGAAAYLARRRH